MSKIDQVRSEMMQALKARDMARKNALSLLLSALKAKFIDKRADLTEAEENEIILHEIKQLKETMEQTPADRTDVLADCKQKLAVYSEFVPRQMSAEEIETVIHQVLGELKLTQPTARDKGKIMKTLMPRVKGRADGRLVNELVGKHFG